MRIASLVPSATEMLFALGLGDSVVAVTHECDYPPHARSLPHLTRTVLPAGLDAGEIDRAVKATVAEGRALYELDEERLAELDPDLIVTQAVCDVCAVSYEDVLEVAARLPSRPRVVQQDPSTLGEMLEDVIRLGEATGMEAEAHELRGELEGRLATVRAAVSGAPPPRVIALEWLDPPFVGGHWIPEMISIAGGEDVAGPPGLKSPEVGWGALSGLDPDVVIAMPCGWYVGGVARAGGRALGADRRPRRRPGLRGRRGLDLLATGAAAGRRGRAARPRPPPRPGRPAREHRLRRGARSSFTRRTIPVGVPLNFSCSVCC